MSSRTYILADVQLLPSEQGGRCYTTSGNFPCWIGIGLGYFEAIIDLTGIGNMSPGQKARVPMEFQTRNLALPSLHVGSEFKLWENSRTIGHGRVIEIYGDAANPTPIPSATGEKSDQNTADRTFPDYQWSAKDAWKCLGTLVLFETMLIFLYIALDWNIHGFYGWRKNDPFGLFLTRLFEFGLLLLTAAYFARTDTLATFWKGFGLHRTPSECVPYGLVAVLILRFVGYFALAHGWSKGVSNPEIQAFINNTGQNRFLFLVPLLVFAPLCEEAFNRGFIYKAFRSSYSMTVSMVILLAWNALTHWNQYSHSYIAAIDLSMLTIVLCYLREKSASLWDCILCHFAFNASGLFVLHVLQ